MSFIKVCDKCKKKSKVTPNNAFLQGWIPVTFNVGTYRRGRSFDICPECAKILSFDTEEKAKSLGEELEDIVYTIAEEASIEITGK